MIGLLFIIPLIVFSIKKKIKNEYKKKLYSIFVLILIQGFVGWYMVQSGLVNRTDVSHYRLAAHLTTAFVTFAFTLWIALDLIFPIKKTINKTYRNLIRIGLAILFIQIIYGAFVAGLDAGFIHNHWPMMSEGKFMHETVLIEKTPVYKNFIEGRSGVQFIHRILAFFVVISVVIIYIKGKKIAISNHQLNGLNSLLILVGVQSLLGVLAILLQVPLWLGIAHQIGAFLLLSSMTFTLHRFSK